MKTSIEDPKTRFMSAFRGEMQANIIEFGKHLWEKDSDVFVFMARKAACFFDCLRELKIADVRGLAVSDRVLDMDLSFLKGKTVTLVDDCVFSGTTLYHARDLVMKAGCKRCDTMALSINEEWIRPNLLPGGDEAEDLNFVTPLFKLDDSQCVQQCYDIVRAISIFPRPYDVDFPHSHTTKLSDAHLDYLLHCSGWQAYDVSTNFQAAHGVRAFTLVPDIHLLHGFMDGYTGLNGLIQAAKIRVYARQLPNSQWSVRLVPIVMLGAVHKSVLEDTRNLWSIKLENCMIEMGADSPKSRYRLLHYLVSWALLKQLTCYLAVTYKLQGAEDASAGFDKVSFTNPFQSFDSIRFDLAEMSFGNKFQSLALNALELLKSVSFPAPVEELDPAALSEFGNDITTVETPQELASACLVPFVWLYKHLELPARALVRSKGLKASLEEENKDLSRLRKGFSPRRLITRLRSSAFDVGRYVSLFLDKAIDLGIAVPTVVDDRGLLFRAFRHGEDAVFGEAEERLSVIALQAYMTERGITSVYGLELQKFVVLFVQIAVRDGSLLERLNTSESVNIGCRVVSIKGHLHGPVPMLTTLDESGTVGSPFVEGLDYPAEWLIKDWEKRGIFIVEKTTRGTKYCVGKAPDIKIGIRKEAQSRKIGRCLGRVIGDIHSVPARPLNNDTDMVLLSTCSEAEHQIRALSGELSILLVRWTPSLNQVREKVRETRFVEAIQLLLSANSLFTALNSGAMKYRWFMDGRLSAVIKEVGVFTQLQDPTGDLSDDWNLLWPEASSPNATTTAPALWGHLNAMGSWLITANVAMRVFHYWLVRSAEANHQETPKQANAVFDDCKKWCGYFSIYCAPLLETPFGELVSQVLRTDSLQPLEAVADQCKQAAAFIEGAGRKAIRQLLSDSRVLCESYGTIGELRPFPYAVFFELENTIGSRSDHYSTHLQITSELLDEEARLVENNHNPWRNGLWILVRGNRNSTKAVELCHKLAARCNAQRLKFRAVVIGQLSYDDSIRDMSGSVKVAAGDFFRRIAEMRPRILPTHFHSSVVLVNERTAGYKSEGKKFRDVSGGKLGSVREVKSGNDDLPHKTFLVSEVRDIPIVVQTPILQHGSQPSLTTLIKLPCGKNGSAKALSETPFLKGFPAGSCVLAVATEWHSAHGGVSTFNRDLCRAFAKEGYQVWCYVPDASAAEILQAKDNDGVNLLSAEPETPTNHDARLRNRPAIPIGLTPDLVISHDRITGPAADSLVRNHFPHSKHVLFIHTAPKQIEWFKEQGDDTTATGTGELRRQLQISLARKAHLVAGVGPKLQNAMANELHALTPPKTAVEFLPGLETPFRAASPPPANECLVLGRAEDADLKGLDIAARAMAKLLSTPSQTIYPTPVLVIRGAPMGSGDALRNDLMQKTHLRANHLHIREYCSDVDVIRRDMLSSALVLMPSRTEGFGLAAMEAIALGIPVLVSDQSGLAETLNTLVPEHAKKCVVHVIADLETDATAWERKIDFVLSDKAAAFARANELRLALAPHLSWQKSVRSLIEAISVKSV